jgi:hypothetical protein
MSTRYNVEPPGLVKDSLTAPLVHLYGSLVGFLRLWPTATTASRMPAPRLPGYLRYGPGRLVASSAGLSHLIKRNSFQGVSQMKNQRKQTATIQYARAMLIRIVTTRYSSI